MIKDKLQLYPLLILLFGFIIPSIPLFLGLLRGNPLAWRVLMLLELILLPIAGYYMLKAVGDGEFQKVITFPLIIIIILVTHSTPVKLWCRISCTIKK
jgi:hypothetical protein